MGCGSSSLKGESAVGGDDNPQPAKRVKTNFSEVDFNSGAAADRRGTMAVAPDEARRPHKISEEIPVTIPTTSRAEPTVEKSRTEQETGAKLEPYKSIEADNAFEDSVMPPKKKEIASDVPMLTDAKPGHEQGMTTSSVPMEHPNPIKV